MKAPRMGRDPYTKKHTGGIHGRRKKEGVCREKVS